MGLPLHRRLGARLVGLGSLLGLGCALQAVLLSTLPVMWPPLVLCGLFVVAFLSNGVRVWSGKLPAARVASFLSGSSVFLLLITGGLLLTHATIHQSWQSATASDFATTVLPLFFGVPLAMVISGWAGQPVRPGRRLRRSVRLYSGLAGLASLLVLVLSLAGGLAVTVWGMAAIIGSIVVHSLSFVLVSSLMGWLDTFDEHHLLDTW